MDRTPEEEKLHRDVFLPSVDNMKLPESEHRDPGDPGDWPTVGEGQPCGGSEVTCAHGSQGHLLCVLPLRNTEHWHLLVTCLQGTDEQEEAALCSD